MSVRAPARVPQRAPSRPRPHVVAPRPNARATPRRRTAGPRLRVVRQPSQRRMLPFLVMSLLLVGMLIAAVAGVQALVSQSSFRMDELGGRIQQLEQRQGELRLQAAELSSPKGIAQEAKRLGLVLPGPPVVLRAPKGDAGSPTAGTGR